MTIVVTGGSGFIGKHLVSELLAKNHTVIVVDVTAPAYAHERLFYIQCDIARQPLPYNVLDRTDALINLVGSPFNKKWNEKVQKNIRDSRIESAKCIVESITSAALRPTVCITASSVAYYGDTGAGYADESSPQGSGFLSDVSAEWERTMKEVEAFGIRVVYMRTAPVLGRAGIVALLQKTFSLGFFLHLSKKDTTMSWIHHTDVVNAYIFALETNTLQGVVNVAAPEATTSRTFVRILAKKLHRLILGTMPQWLAQIVFGDFYAVLTKNSHAVPHRLMDKGFAFSYPAIADALKEVAQEIKKYKKNKNSYLSVKTV